MKIMSKKDMNLIISVLTFIAGVYLCVKANIAFERGDFDIYSLGVLILGGATILHVLRHGGDNGDNSLPGDGPE